MQGNGREIDRGEVGGIEYMEEWNGMKEYPIIVQ